MRKVIDIPIWYKKNRIVELRKDYGLNQSEVANKIGCVLKTYQNYEQGHNFPTLEYATNLADLYKVSIDYLLGKSDYTHVENEDIEKITGLSNDAIEMLKILSNYRMKYQSIMPELGADIDAINAMLEYQYFYTKKNEKDGMPGWSIFHYIKQYLSSEKFEREMQDRLRVCDGSVWVDIENGDVLQKGDKQYKVMRSEAINSKTGSGTNSKTLHIFNTQNPKDRYVVDIAKIFSTYSKDNIFKELDKIKAYLDAERK